MTLSDQAAWYVVHSRPKCEHLAAALMLGLDGVETYCPRIKFQRTTKRGKVWFIEALFPSYFFARFVPLQSVRGVRHSQNVIRIVEFGGSLVPVPDEVIETIRQEMDGKVIKEIQPELKVGDTVELTEGPMRGFKGIVNCIRNGEDRVQILLEFLGRQNLVEAPASKVLPEHSPRELLGASS